MAVTVFPAPSTGGTAKSQTSVIIKSTTSWTAPVGVTQVEVILCGGGGGAFGLAGFAGNRNGGAGSVFYDFLTVTPGTSYTITIGAGGAGTSSFPANAGGNSSFGGLLTATGGAAALSGGIQNAGSGVGGAGGWVNRTQSAPEIHSGMLGAYGLGGGGGAVSGEWTDNSSAGANGGGRGVSNAAGLNAVVNTGSGGGAGGGTSGGTFNGGNGGSGICIIRYWS
jgi:hypothetical protein